RPAHRRAEDEGPPGDHREWTPAADVRPALHPLPSAAEPERAGGGRGPGHRAQELEGAVVRFPQRSVLSAGEAGFTPAAPLGEGRRGARTPMTSTLLKGVRE